MEERSNGGKSGDRNTYRVCYRVSAVGWRVCSGAVGLLVREWIVREEREGGREREAGQARVFWRCEGQQQETLGRKSPHTSNTTHSPEFRHEITSQNNLPARMNLSLQHAVSFWCTFGQLLCSIR